ncbi:SecDF P1 head subdomain-containing protein [Maribacter sp. 2-571]|uniref:SecDF P1 head subdomain-containing protein n=1 Tax=Maribacter sp. 2-571 TaxID=3417569 RepID=UPI003D34DB9F
MGFPYDIRPFFIVVLGMMHFMTNGQQLPTGFYQVDDSYEGTLVRELDNKTDFYVVPTPILTLGDIEAVQPQPDAFGGGFNLVFELNDTGTEKFKNFTQENHPTEGALLLNGKLVSKAMIAMPIPNGMFNLSGFDLRKASAVSNSIQKQMGKVPLFEKDGFSVFTDRALGNDRTIYDAKSEHEAFIKKEAAPGSDCPLEFSAEYRPLSLIGSSYSYEFSSVSASACGHAGVLAGVKTVAVHSGEEVSILKYFTEQAVVSAFKKDAWVVQRAKENHLNVNTITSFADVLEFFGPEHGIVFSPSGFCIVAYGNKMAKVRFVGSEYLGWNHQGHLQLGFELQIRPEVQSEFEASDNFFLGRFRNTLKN